MSCDVGEVTERLENEQSKQKRNSKNEIGASIERTSTKSIPKLAQQVGISESSAHRATKLLNLKPYKCTSVHSLKHGCANQATEGKCFCPPSAAVT